MEVVAVVARRWVGSVPAARAAVVVVVVVAVGAAAAAAVAGVVCVIAVVVGVAAAVRVAAHTTAFMLQHRPTCWCVGAGASEPTLCRASV